MIVIIAQTETKMNQLISDDSVDNPMCEQGSSLSVKMEESKDSPPVVVFNTHEGILDTPVKPGENVTLNQNTPVVRLAKEQKTASLLDPKTEIVSLKSKPKRMGSERPDRKSPKKLKKAPMIKNSLSLRSNKKNGAAKQLKEDKFSDSDNDASSNREYSEEQGRKALQFGFSSNCKSNSAFSKSESKQVGITKSTNYSIKSSMRFSKAKTNTNF